MSERLLLLILAVNFSGCVPGFYRVGFPATAIDRIPEHFFSPAEEVLVVPIWIWYKRSEFGIGPPTFLMATELDRLPKEIKGWRGLEIVDVLGHEGSDAPSAWGAILIGSGGRGLRLEYKLSPPQPGAERAYWYWEAEDVYVGPRIKGALAQGFKAGAFEKADLEFVFGIPLGDLLGESVEIRQASEFVERLSGLGSDSWTALDGQQ